MPQVQCLETQPGSPGSATGPHWSFPTGKRGWEGPTLTGAPGGAQTSPVCAAVPGERVDE